MKSWHCMVVALLGCTSASAVDPQGPEGALRTPATDRTSIEILEHDWLAHESDRGSLERILADDFVHVVPEGLFLTKEQHVEWALKYPRPPSRRARFEDLRVRLYGDTAVATGIVDNSDAAGADVHRTVFTDVFVFRAGAWKAVNAQENPVLPRS
ncbi:MAG TPA: nuclear transport factor 2 family protein [bacterium]|nr:nuclear transport factor 2 family protein [bacterium]